MTPMKKQFSLWHTSTVVTLVLIGANLGSIAHPSLAQQVPKRDVQLANSETDWLTADWTEDNSKYAATRVQIDKLISQGQKPAILATRYRLRGNDRYDSQKIYRWSYASYRKQKLAPEQNALIGVNEAMNLNLRPGAYDWVRLRFLVTSMQLFMRPTSESIALGRRLLRAKKNDEDVAFCLERNLQYSQSLEDRKEAVVMSRANARKHPRDVYWQWMVADSVRFVNDFTGKPTYKGNQETMTEYKKTLQMLPLDHPYRKRIIRELVYLDLNFDSEGKPVKWTSKMYREALKNTTLR